MKNEESAVTKTAGVPAEIPPINVIGKAIENIAGGLSEVRPKTIGDAATQGDPNQLTTSGLSTDPLQVQVRKEHAAHLLVFKDWIAEGDAITVNLPYIEVNGDFENPTTYEIAKTIEAKLRLPMHGITIEQFEVKVKADPGIIYDDPVMFQALRDAYKNPGLGEWQRIKKALQKAKIGIKDLIKKFNEGEPVSEAPIVTPFIEFDGGKLAEMVVQDGIGKFAVYDPETDTVTYVEELEVDGHTVIPPINTDAFKKHHVTLPTKAEDYIDIPTLCEEIRTFVHKYLDVSKDYEIIASVYPLLSWVYDVMSAILYLRAKGDWGTGKSRFMEVFGAICYRAIATTGAMSDAPIFRLMDLWRSTLIMDEGDLGKGKEANAAMEKILNCGFQPNKPIWKCNPNDCTEVNAYEAFSPKILATRYEFRDKALESRCFTEIMTESNKVPIELPPEFYTESEHIRNQLLMYRFKNRAKIKARSSLVDPLKLKGLSPRLQQAARPMAVILVDNKPLLEDLKAFLKKKAKALVKEASETTEGHLVRLLDGMGLKEGKDKDGEDVVTWCSTYAGLRGELQIRSGDFNITTAMIRSRANSLGFKTEKKTVDKTQQRYITCRKSIYENLQRRYIPVADDAPDEPDDAPDDESETAK